MGSANSLRRMPAHYLSMVCPFHRPRSPFPAIRLRPSAVSSAARPAALRFTESAKRDGREALCHRLRGGCFARRLPRHARGGLVHVLGALPLA
jgi:hypothetical protein